MSTEQQRITVEIFGERHVIRGEGTPEYIQGLAREVDKKMRLIAQRIPKLAVHQVAVLVALNYADEYAKLKEEQNSLMELLGENSGEK